jgi:hypothetical protein
MVGLDRERRRLLWRLRVVIALSTDTSGEVGEGISSVALHDYSKGRAGMRGARRGAIIQVVTDHLRVNTPAGVVTAADRAALAEHKTELIVMLGGPVARGERVESGVLGAPPSGFLRVVPHAHACRSCSRRFRCTAPSCAGQPKRCVCCTLDAIEGRGRR